MKRMMLVLMTAGMVGSVLPVFSGDDDAARQKDECLLIARDCGSSVQSIQDKIERLKEEIAKGATVYTPEELNLLKHRLDEVNRVLDLLGNKSPYVDERRRQNIR
jgi:hypothetical protein